MEDRSQEESRFWRESFHDPKSIPTLGPCLSSNLSPAVSGVRFSLRKYSVTLASCSGRELAFEMCLDLFQSLALGFRKEEDNGDEVDDGERSEEKKHGRIAVLGDE